MIPCRPVVPSLNCVSVGLDHPYLEAFCRLPTLVGLQMFQPLSFPTFHIVPYRFVLLGKTSLTGDVAAVCLRSLTLRGNLQMFSTLTVPYRFVRMKYHLPGDVVAVCLHTPNLPSGILNRYFNPYPVVSSVIVTSPKYQV